MRRLGVLMVVASHLAFACEDGSELVGEALRGEAGVDGASQDVSDVASERFADVPDARLELSPGLDASPETQAPSGTETGADLPPEATAALPPEAADAATGDADTGVSGDSPSGMASGRIVAALGGTLELGEAQLLVPAHALATDVTISLRAPAPGVRLAAGADVQGQQYAFEPSGTVFEVPVVVSLPLTEAPPADKEAVIAWLNEATGQLIPVPSRVESGRVIGLVTHVAPLAVLFVSKMSPCPFSGACGSTLEGTWRHSSACFRTPPALDFKCGTAPSLQIRNTIETTGGTLTVAAGQYQSRQMTTLRSMVFVTSACLAALNAAETLHADCASVQAGLAVQRRGPWTCKGTVAQGCSCVLVNPSMRDEMGAVAEGQKFADVCVRGDVLTFRDSGGAVHSAVRQP